MKLLKVAKKGDMTRECDSLAGDKLMQIVYDLENARAHLANAANDYFIICKRAAAGDLGDFPAIERENIARTVAKKGDKVAELARTLAAANKMILSR